MNDSRDLAARLASTDFAAEDLVVLHVRGTEQISRLFQFDVGVRAPAAGLPDRCVPGAHVTLVLEAGHVSGHGVSARYVHGIVDAIHEGTRAIDDRRAFAIRIAPLAARLELTETQEVFVDESVPSVVREKLALHGLAEVDVDLRLRGTYAARDSIVQYGESDLAFVSRLTEHAGVSFFFEHEREGTRLVFTDAEGGFSRAIPLACHGRADGDGLHSLVSRRQRIPSSVLVQDHNYRSPLVELTGERVIEGGHGGGVVHYATHHRTPDEADHTALVRAEEIEGRRIVHAGSSGAIALAAGRRIAVHGHADLADGTELLVTKVTHDATLHADGADAGATYANTFEAVPAGFTYRPPRVTPRPRIHGFVTGIVKSHADAEDGSVAYLDEHGRYLVELQFDTLRPPHKQRASHRIRMAQPFAGPNHGMHFPLRPGAEVLVAFLDGDPDRPVIVGAVPNHIAPSPVNHLNPNTHVLTTASGVRMTIRD